MDWDFLIEEFDYDPATGELWRLRGPAKGKPCRSTDGNGYLCVWILGRSCKVARIIWWLVYGDDPEGLVDHQDQNKQNNRLRNFRLTTRKGNATNSKLRVDNSSGHVGVALHKQSGRVRWRAYITINGKQILLGLFENKADAINARKTAERKYNFHPNHGKKD